MASAVGLRPPAVRDHHRSISILTPGQDREIYDELYHRIYREMYVRLKPLYLEIQKISGYPRFD